MCVVVGGSWENGDVLLLESLKQFENQIVQRLTNPLPPYHRPWMHEMNFACDYYAPVNFVSFPSADEDGNNNNHVSIAARTVPITDFQTWSLIQLLLESFLC